VAEGIGPEFKPQNHQKKEREREREMKDRQMKKGVLGV
jgi:hypothetical protein